MLFLSIKSIEYQVSSYLSSSILRGIQVTVTENTDVNSIW